jgi:hypothetical protein
VDLPESHLGSPIAMRNPLKARPKAAEELAPSRTRTPLPETSDARRPPRLHKPGMRGLPGPAALACRVHSQLDCRATESGKSTKLFLVQRYPWEVSHVPAAADPDVAISVTPLILVRLPPSSAPNRSWRPREVPAKRSASHRHRTGGSVHKRTGPRIT